jgi:hypothetical protein
VKVSGVDGGREREREGEREGERERERDRKTESHRVSGGRCRVKLEGIQELHNRKALITVMKPCVEDSAVLTDGYQGKGKKGRNVRTYHFSKFR